MEATLRGQSAAIRSLRNLEVGKDAGQLPLTTIEQAIADSKVERFHFTLLRNLYEKTASFLGYPKWSELLPDDKQLYYSRIINFTSHSTLSNEAVAEPTPQERATVQLLLDHLKNSHGFWQQQGA